MLGAGGRSAQHRQKVNGQQRPKWIGLNPRAEVWNLPERIDYRANLFNGVPGLDPGLGFDHGQRWLEVLGLQTPTRVAAQLAHKQPLGFIMAHIAIALMSPRTVGLSPF